MRSVTAQDMGIFTLVTEELLKQVHKSSGSSVSRSPRSSLKRPRVKNSCSRSLSPPRKITSDKLLQPQNV